MTSVEEVAGYIDVPLEVDVELHRHRLTVRNLLKLEAGTVIPLKRSAGENLDVRIGGVLVGFGEIVVSETSTGIRLTDFVHPE